MFSSDAITLFRKPRPTSSITSRSRRVDVTTLGLKAELIILINQMRASVQEWHGCSRGHRTVCADG
jgi:hypothetical protein